MMLAFSCLAIFRLFSGAATSCLLPLPFRLMGPRRKGATRLYIYVQFPLRRRRGFVRRPAANAQWRRLGWRNGEAAG
jgi:hypothetical protein